MTPIGTAEKKISSDKLIFKIEWNNLSLLVKIDICWLPFFFLPNLWLHNLWAAHSFGEEFRPTRKQDLFFFLFFFDWEGLRVYRVTGISFLSFWKYSF